MDTRNEFDAKAKGYEGGRLGRWYKAQGELVLDAAQLHSGDSALDVGCGTGWLLRRMARRYQGVRGLGLDLAPRMIELARERTRVEAISDLTFVAGDWLSLDPLLLVQAHDMPAVDLVSCVSTFHYFSDPARALRQMAEVTQPGGRLLLLDRSRDRSPITLLWDLVHRAILRDTVRFYSSAELLTLVRDAGYEEARVVRRVRRLFWKGKLSTSLALISAVRP